MSIRAGLKFEADIFEQADLPIGTKKPCVRIWAVDGDKREAILFKTLDEMMPSRRKFLTGSF